MRRIWQRKNDQPVCHFNKDLSDQKLVLEVEKYFLLSKKVERIYLFDLPTLWQKMT